MNLAPCTTFVALSAPLPQLPRRHISHPRTTPTCELYRRALAVDYGLVRVGMAVSLGFAPRPLRCVKHNGKPAEVAAAVTAAARRECARDIVVGLPLTFAGREGEQAEATRLFVADLVKAARWATIYLLDERFTTQLARASLAADNVPKARVAAMLDSAAAVEIANRFFAADEIGEVTPELVHKPQPRELAGRESGDSAEVEGEGMPGDQDTIDSEHVMRESFFAWRKNAMAQAAEDQRNMKGTKRRRGKKCKRL
jgi:putative holliday junction resolvase